MNAPVGDDFDPAPRPLHRLPRFDVTLMEHVVLGGRDSSLKRDVYALFIKHQDRLLRKSHPVEGLSKSEHRQFVRDCLHLLLKQGYSPLSYFAKDPHSYFNLGEYLSLIDLSLTVKMGVQYSLWGGSILNLGTERHRKKFFTAIDQFQIPGCFAMTELKHGSNVAALQTEAVLDLATDEWVIHTPDDGAIKWWIGNAAEDGQMATVFARLKIRRRGSSEESQAFGGLEDFGVHAFVVPLRDSHGNQLDGVEIRDCGYKVGLQGVDNGAIRFTHVRVPRENLLDRFASVGRDGKYTSPLETQGKRFAATLGELTGGRVGLTFASLGVLKGATTIAVRYSAHRQQFGPDQKSPLDEVAVLDYPSQQLKLMPMLATAYALHFTRDVLIAKYTEMKRKRDDNDVLVADVHSLSAGLKAYTTSYTNAALSVARECCGGHGYAAVNRLGALRSDHDIFQTFEGDNTVLLQQVAALLLKQYKDSFSESSIVATFSYLGQMMQDALPTNPLVSHATEPRHLRNPEFLKKALRYRTARLLHTLAARLRKHTAISRKKFGAASAGFHAWNACLIHVLALSRAHIESVMLEAFFNAVDTCPDVECRKSLKAMADLFALERIHADVLFRNEDYVAPEKEKAIRKMIEHLCAELRAVAVPLVDSFGIPDEILRAPIGLSGASGAEPYDAYLSSVGFGGGPRGART